MIRRGAFGVVAAIVVGAHPACVAAQQGGAASPAFVEDAGRELLSEKRLQQLPAGDRAAWAAYIARSRRLHDADTAAMNAELRRAGLAHMAKATYSKLDFGLTWDRSDDWFRGDSATLIADAVLTYQTPSGGWSKRTDMSRPRRSGESYYSETEAWHYIPTLDNGATSGQLHFLAGVLRHHDDSRYRAAYRRGIELLLAAQEPNGCWPQSYPLEGGYHDAITFNDDATVNVLRALDEAASSGASGLPSNVQRAASESAERGVTCLLATQVKQNGKRTVWGQQHDPLTFEVVPARRYELAGLSGRESASIMTYLMSLPRPSTRLVDAVHAAADWFRAHAIVDQAYDFQNGLVASPGAGPIWARLTDLETDRPIFSNRDGVKLYDFDRLTDRRTGYAWFGTEPASALKQYDRWARQHPRAGGPAAVGAHLEKP
jgi:PelA/Pel-15E family pectate lyase